MIDHSLSRSVQTFPLLTVSKSHSFEDGSPSWLIPVDY